MKKAALSFILLVLTISVFSQDYILTKKGNKINGKITRVDNDLIYVTYIEDRNEVKVVIEKSDIDSISYGKGDAINRSNGIEYKQKPINLSTNTDEVPRSIMFGAGLNIGIFDPSDFNSYVNKYAEYVGMKPTIAEVSTNLGFNGFVGYRITSMFAFNLAGSFTRSLNIVSDGNGNGNTFNYDKISFGLVGDLRIPLNRKLGLDFAFGLMQNFMSLSTTKVEIISGNSLGYRVQGGLDFYTSKLFTLQGLIGGEYADAKNKGFDLNYSGFLFTINAILNI